MVTISRSLSGLLCRLPPDPITGLQLETQANVPMALGYGRHWDRNLEERGGCMA